MVLYKHANKQGSPKRILNGGQILTMVTVVSFDAILPIRVEERGHDHWPPMDSINIQTEGIAEVYFARLINCTPCTRRIRFNHGTTLDRPWDCRGQERHARDPVPTEVGSRVTFPSMCMPLLAYTQDTVYPHL